MKGKNAFDAAEWELVTDAPQWVYAALAAADGRSGIFKSRKEAKAFENKLESYKAGNKLVRDVLADDDKRNRSFENVTLAEAEKALNKIGDILDERGVDAEADGFRNFLLVAGRTVAEAKGEGLKSILPGDEKISDKEEETLNMIAIALKATERDKQRRQREEDRERRAEAARKRREEEARKQAEAEERRKTAAEARARREAARAQAKAAAEAKAQAEAQAKAAEEARAKATAKAKAKAERDAKIAEAKEAARKRREELAEAQAAQEAAEKAAEEAQQTYVVQAGDSLSAIALKFYGSAARWPEIFEANKDTVKKASLIYPGQELIIP